MSKWIDVWEEEPPRDEDILFMDGWGRVHIGVLIESFQKLRKCEFMDFATREIFMCDKDSPKMNKVFFWHPLPELTQKQEEIIDG